MAIFGDITVKNVIEVGGYVLAAISFVVVAKIRTWFLNRKPFNSKEFETSISANLKIRDLLSELRAIYDSDRVVLFQFHNGSHFVVGSSVMHLTPTHFVTKTGITGFHINQSILTTHMLNSLKCLHDNQVCKFTHEQDIDDEFQYSLFATNGNTTAVCIPVRCKNKNWIGILSVSWLDETNKFVKDDLITYAQHIGEFLALKS